MTRDQQLSASREAAVLLAGCWRAKARDLPDLPEWTTATSLLERSGCDGLAFQQLSAAGIPVDRGSHRYEQFQKHCLRGSVREHFLEKAAGRLNTAGVDWMLLKGWAIGRFYPDPKLRSSGDLDILVRRAHLSRAEQALEGLDRRVYPIDLLTQIRSDYGRAPDELLERSVTEALNGCSIQVPRPEDQLRHLCLHLWKHSAWRPVWLSDIGAALEHRPGEFDWDLCLYGSPRAAEWIEAACRIASELLDAELGGTPFARTGRRMPRWLVETVLLNWHRERARPFWDCVRAGRSRLLLQNVRVRYPDPIRAALRGRGPFGPCPYSLRPGLFILDIIASLLRPLSARRPGKPAALNG